jgi:hypothetical protein
MGWHDAALYVMARILASASRGRLSLRKYYFISQPVPRQPLLPPQRGRAFSVCRVGSEHPLTASFPRPAQVIARRFRDGASCFLASRDDRLAGFLWLQSATYYEDEVRSQFIPLPARKAVWDFDVHLEEIHRASFAFARLWDAANAFLRDSGVEWSLSRVSAFNAVSLNSHMRLGARPIGSACYVTGRAWQLMLSDVPPYVHFSRNGDSVPRIELKADTARRPKYGRFVR